MSLSNFANENAFSENSQGDFMENRSTLNLTELFYDFRGRRKNFFPGAVDLTAYLQPDFLKESQLATLFWQLVTEDVFFKELARKNYLSEYDEIVVCQANGQYSLLIFAESNEVKTTSVTELNSVNISMPAAVRSWAKSYQKDLYNNYNNRPLPDGSEESLKYLAMDRFYNQLILRPKILVDFATELSQKQNFKIIITRPPQRRYLKSIVPSPYTGVSEQSNTSPTSTAGVFTSNVNGIPGVTVALHALNDLVQGQTIYIDNKPGKVISINEITDSCFVELPDLNRSRLNSIKGPLSGITPRQYQPAYFEGLRSEGSKKAIIDSWVKDITIDKRGIQKRVFTDLVANPGDSGSTLIDDEKNVVGFAFYNSGIADPIQATSWIWADSVFKAHNLVWNT